MLCGNYILSNRSEWTFYFLSSVQFNFTIGEKNKINSNALMLSLKNKDLELNFYSSLDPDVMNKILDQVLS